MKGKLNWGWLEAFVLVTYLLNGLLLLPGTQSFRVYIRAAPYVFSLALLVFCLLRRRAQNSAPGGMAMALMVLLLIANLLHPTTHLHAGLAQVFFQLAIAAPVFWAARLTDNEARLRRFLWLVLIANAINSGVGLLQIYFPERFLPAEFSRAFDQYYLASLSYYGADGQVIFRPPGLSDLPGGAGVAGAMTALLALGFSARRGERFRTRVVCLLLALAGTSVLYLAQVRSLAIMLVLGLALMIYFGARQARVWKQSWLTLAIAVAIFGSFAYAVSVGGETVRERFATVAKTGVVQSWQGNRGLFWNYTIEELLPRYPLGAGVGRWGMMSNYFGEQQRADSPLLYAEIQMTGWLLDGGVPMWILYPAGLFFSLLFVYRMALSRRYGRLLPHAAGIIFCANFCVVGSTLSGPSFNSTMGMQFWALAGALYGAAKAEAKAAQPYEVPAAALEPEAASLA